MFTPHRKSWVLSPRVGDSPNPRSAGGGILGRSKGKGVAVAGVPDSALLPPPQASLGDKGGERGDAGGDEVEVWRRFRDEGLLDETTLQRKDREALVCRIEELESELHEYQYNMGLLLIEKKEWSSSYEETRLRLAEAEEILKREQTAHIIGISESEKREENLRKALGVEKQCVADLEKAVRDMRGESAEIKFTAENKLSEAHALEASLEEKQLEVERKLHSADAKLAEASRKCSEVDRKVEDVDARERKVQREVLSFNAERKSHEKDITEQKEHLRNWEKQLQDSQRMLLDGQTLLNEREDKANEMDRVLKKKEEELEETKKLIDVTTTSLRNKEVDANTRLRTLSLKEKDAEVKMKNLEKKERALLALEEKLNAREREEIQKLVDEHQLVLEAKKQEFELEVEKKRELFDQELKCELKAVEKEKKEIKRKEEQLGKREKTLENKLEKLHMKEKDLDTKSKALKKWEESVKSDEKKLEAEKQQLMKESEELSLSRTELEGLRAAIKVEEQQILTERENLKLTKEERESNLNLQSKLKQEIEEYRMMKESLAKEQEALKEEKETFEKEWESLDDKRLELEMEAKKVNAERERFEKWCRAEQERLKSEGLQASAEIQRELEDLKLKKEAFERTMEHEKSVAREEVEKKLADVDREMELRKHRLEMNMLERQEDMEKKLQEKEEEFVTRRETELSRIASLVNLNDAKMRKLKVEQERLEREKEDLSIQTKKLEADQLEIQKDIDTLRALSKNLKDQRTEFIKERESFLAAAEQCKTCQNCGVLIGELEVLSFQPTEIENEDVPLRSLADGFIEEHSAKGKQNNLSRQGNDSHSGGRKSWLEKCSSIFKFSPRKNVDHDATEEQAEVPVQFGERLDMAASEDVVDYRVANESSDVQRAQEKAADELEPSFEVGDNSVDVVRMSDYGTRQAEGERVIASADDQNETEGSSLPPENDSEAQPSKQQRRQPSRRGKAKTSTVKRTRSVKAVVQEAKAILGEKTDPKVEELNGEVKDSQQIGDESQETSLHAEPVAANTRQKRRRPQTSEMTVSELEGGDSEGQSQSISIGGRRKRRQTSTTVMPNLGDKRYNLRHSKVASSVAVTQATSDQTKGRKSESHQPSADDGEASKGDDHVAEGTSKDDAHALVSPSVLAEENNKATQVLQTTTVGVFTEVHEMSSHNLVQRKVEEIRVESEIIKSVEISEGTQEEGKEVDGATATSEPATPSDGSYATQDSDEEMDDEEEGGKKHDASIGKKLWKFFTT